MSMSQDPKYLAIVKESLELLHAIELIEYHDKNWLTNWAIKSPKELNEQKRGIIRRGLQAMVDYDCPPPEPSR